ncbi:hypothetical protein BDV36DRAFT_223952 [Aspergillus pseudocaelatus]|uniref:Uncharacterized protein n=1 Tax=Aspergillus pseudocaelatus TaxID=1825620 RepID=A0ABQ6WEH6_9EURO|nr:hypothetical protein BDV36DRAFT_223952 [Aspergillus pseudocaelatus]
MFVGPNLILSLYYTVNFPDGRPDSQEAILENEVLINYLPTWKALFFFIPFSLQHLPATYALSEEVRIHLAMIVCFWPAWLVGTAYLMQTRPNHDCLRSSTTRHSIMQRLRSGYVFSFYVAVVSHLGTVLWCLSLGETPGRAMYAMFVPPVPWAPHLTSNPQEFVFSVFKCAYAVSSAAMCVWALVAYLRSCEQQRRTSTGVTGVELKLLLILGIGGPYAVAMQLLIWRNDVLNDTQKN